MGWELRGNQRYYYRKIRRGRQVVSSYVGAGEVAQLIYLIDGSDREQVRIEQTAWKKIKEEYLNLDMEIGKLNRKINMLVTATLLISGHHQHKGQWRKSRNAKQYHS